MSYPYTKKPSSLRDFLKKIPTIKVPEKISQKILYALGYKSTNDRPITKILRFIGFLNGSGVPTENYVNFRSREKSGKVMADCLKSAYEDLFKLYEDAYGRTNEELRDFFSTRVSGGEQVLIATVNTFKTLCEFADFKRPPPGKKGKEKDEEKGKELLKLPTGVPINLNIQLTLPVTDDAKVYENIFKALKEQLFTRE